MNFRQNGLRQVLCARVFSDVALSLLCVGVACARPARAKVRVLRFPPILSAVIHRYTSSRSLRLTVQKSMKLALLDRNTTENGRILMKNGKFRMEFGSPLRSLIVVGARYIWLATYPSSQLGGPVQVVKSARTSRGRSPVLLSLLSRRDPSRYFIVTSIHISGHSLTYLLKPRQKAHEVKRILLKVNGKKREIVSLSYWDELKNKTDYKFLKTDWNPKLSDSLFRFVPPKGASVSSY